MIEHVAQASLLGYSGIFILLFALQVIYLKDRIWNLFDPLLLILMNISLNAAIVLFMFVNGQVDYSIAIYILFGTCFFCLGMNSKRLRIGPPCAKPNKAIGFSPKVTVVCLLVSLFYQTITMIFTFKQIGFGILTGSVNPDIIKVSLTQGGMGIFRHIGSAGELLFLPLIAHAFFTYKMRRLAFACIVYYVLKSMLFPMSKSGLVLIVFDFGILMHFYKIKFNYIILKTRKVLFVALIGVFPSLIVLYNLSSRYEMSISQMIVERFIVTGYGTYQYFILGGMNFFENLSVLDRFNYYFDTILSMLKIKEWGEMSYVAQMGYQLTGVAIPGYGANPYIFLDGHFLFGWIGILYCYTVGALIACARSSNTNIILFYILVKMSAFLVTDPAIAQSLSVALMLYMPLGLLLYLGAKSSNTQLNSNLIQFFVHRVLREKV
jgi:hypothetical protein